MSGVRPTTLAKHQGPMQCAPSPIAPRMLHPTNAAAARRCRAISGADPGRLTHANHPRGNSTAPRLGRRVNSTRDSQHGPPCKDSPACFIDFANSGEDGDSSQPPPGRPGNISSVATCIPLKAAFAKRESLWAKAGWHCQSHLMPKGRGIRTPYWFSVLWLLMSFAALSTASDTYSEPNFQTGNGKSDRRSDTPWQLPLRAWRDMTTVDFQAMMKDDSIEPIAVLQVRLIPVRPAPDIISR